MSVFMAAPIMAVDRHSSEYEVGQVIGEVVVVVLAIAVVVLVVRQAWKR